MASRYIRVFVVVLLDVFELDDVVTFTVSFDVEVPSVFADAASPANTGIVI